MPAHRYFVTGAGGFIGRHLVRHLVSQGDVLALLGPGSLLREESPWQTVQFQRADIRDAEAIARLLREFRPTVVFHLAAAGLVPADSPADVFSANVQGTYNVLSGMLKSSTAERLVTTGSWFEYGSALGDPPPRFPSPSSIYGLSKLAATRLVQSFSQEADLAALVLRPFQVYGPLEPPQRLIPYVVKCARDRQPVVLTNPSVQKDWVYVDDVVDALQRAGRVRGHGQTVDIGTGTLTSVSEVAQAVVAAVGREVTVSSGEPSASDRALSGAAEIQTAEQLLGWKATTRLNDGITKTVAARAGVD